MKKKKVSISVKKISAPILIQILSADTVYRYRNSVGHYIKRSVQFLKLNAFLTCSWRFLRSNTLEQFKLEKIIGIQKPTGKVKKWYFLITYKRNFLLFQIVIIILKICKWVYQKSRTFNIHIIQPGRKFKENDCTIYFVKR